MLYFLERVREVEHFLWMFHCAHHSISHQTI